MNFNEHSSICFLLTIESIYGNFSYYYNNNHMNRTDILPSNILSRLITLLIPLRGSEAGHRASGTGQAVGETRLRGERRNRGLHEGPRGRRPGAIPPARRECGTDPGKMRIFAPIFAKIIAKADMVKPLNSLKPFSSHRRKCVPLRSNAYFWIPNVGDILGQGRLAGLGMARYVLFVLSFPRTRETRMIGMPVAALDSRLHGNDRGEADTGMTVERWKMVSFRMDEDARQAGRKLNHVIGDFMRRLAARPFPARMGPRRPRGRGEIAIFEAPR